MASRRYHLPFRPTRGGIFKTLLVVILLVWPLAYHSGYAMRIMTTGGLYTLLTIAVVVILGQAGQLSFGHSAFYGLGAYTAAILTAKLGVPTLAALVIGALFAGVIAVIIGRPVLKLRYFYLALATIGLGQIFLVLVLQFRTVTNSTLGIKSLPNLDALGFAFNNNLRRYYLVWIIAIIIALLIDRALKFRVGRALRAIATSEIASTTLGIRTPNWKLMAFVTSAVICGLAGGLYVFVNRAVVPGAFSFTGAVIPIVIMLIGGGSVWGSIVGAVLMAWVMNGFGGIQQYSGVAYSIVMILLLVFLPAGLALTPGQRARLRAFWRRETLREPAGRAVPVAVVEGETLRTAVVSGVRDVPAVGRSADASSPEQAGTSVARVVHTQETSAPLLEIKGVSVHFGGLKAVDGVSLQVPTGKIVAIIGPNGAGKTTLFNVVSRLQKPTAGQIHFVGRDVTKLSAADTARLGMARTFQNLRIYANMTVLDNVLVGCHRHESSGLFAGAFGLPRQRREERLSRERALWALAAVGLESSAHLPAASLPYGWQRLVEIARALASEPRLLLLDEPAAGMNASERAHLVQQIARIRDSGITVLLVEHDIELVMGISDLIYVLDYGRLICQGTPEVVHQDPAVIEAYLGAKHEDHETYCQTRELTEGTSPEPEALLAVTGLATSYGSIQALRGVSFVVPEREVVAVLGANGAGKSTLLHTISGLLRPKEGSIIYQGADITRLNPESIVARGLCQVPEGRRLFRDLSVHDNLVVGSSGGSDWRRTMADDIAFVYELFPVLGERRKQQAGTLSGGEQQMLAIGRALMGRPRLLLLDEPSMGLAPLMVERIFESLAALNKEGLTMLMVEQSADMALSLAHRAVVLQTGSVACSGLARDLTMDERVRTSYLGGSQG